MVTDTVENGDSAENALLTRGTGMQLEGEEQFLREGDADAAFEGAA